MRQIERGIARETLHHNVILRGLGESLVAQLLQRGRLEHLALRQQIYEPNQTIDTVYFPLSCVISIVTQMKDGSLIEVGTIGNEGLSALPLLMGATTTANESFCQVPGAAIAIESDLFVEFCRIDRHFRLLLDRYLQAYVNMLGQLAACNRLHTVYERCARWLLLTHDRVESERIKLTHEFLAMMLGTGRSGVTIAANGLQQAGFISYSHGVITIRNRSGLEDASCECYELAREQFAGLVRSASARSDSAIG